MLEVLRSSRHRLSSCHEAAMNPTDVAVDLSIFELFKNAHIVVKLVIIGLLLASIWS